MAIELHVHEPRFNFSPSVGGRSAEPTDGGIGLASTDADADGDQEEESGGRSKFGALLALLVLVALALAVRKVRSGDDVELDIED